jgi:hypothetical protein
MDNHIEKTPNHEAYNPHDSEKKDVIRLKEVQQFHAIDRVSRAV